MPDRTSKSRSIRSFDHSSLNAFLNARKSPSECSTLTNSSEAIEDDRDIAADLTTSHAFSNP
jgi:hypothetical protein